MQPKQGLLLRTKCSFCEFLELGSLATDFLCHQSFFRHLEYLTLPFSIHLFIIKQAVIFSYCDADIRVS